MRRRKKKLGWGGGVLVGDTPGFNQALVVGKKTEEMGGRGEDVMKMRRWPLFAVCHGIDSADTMPQCMTDQSN